MILQSFRIAIYQRLRVRFTCNVKNEILVCTKIFPSSRIQRMKFKHIRFVGYCEAMQVHDLPFVCVLAAGREKARSKAGATL